MAAKKNGKGVSVVACRPVLVAKPLLNHKDKTYLLPMAVAFGGKSMT